MSLLLLSILAVSGISMVFNIAYITHELGWFPHTKDRRKPIDRKFYSGARFERNRLTTHSFQVMHALNYELRKLGHSDVYSFKDPYHALENVIRRYEENPTRSRYDDLVHLANYINNHVQTDEKINVLIDRISELALSKPYMV